MLMKTRIPKSIIAWSIKEFGEKNQQKKERERESESERDRDRAKRKKEKGKREKDEELGCTVFALLRNGIFHPSWVHRGVISTGKFSSTNLTPIPPSTPVHFTQDLKIMTHRTSVKIGRKTQMSNNGRMNK
jgi:hypothetical protein